MELTIGPVPPWEQPLSQQLSQEERAAYLSNARDFLNTPTTTRAAIESGKDFHTAKIDFSQPVVSAPFYAADELEERVGLAKEFQEAIRREADHYEHNFDLSAFRLSLIQFSAFLCGDIDHLRYQLQWTSRCNLFNSLRAIEALLAHCEYLQFTHRVVFIRSRGFRLLISRISPVLQDRDPEQHPSTLTKKRKVAAVDSGPGEDDDSYQDPVGPDGSRMRDQKERDRVCHPVQHAVSPHTRDKKKSISVGISIEMG
ncbi:hypothetical protein IMZ48_01475 [Candidatus Bathyarchaeota archaeon]|nr:hypothetical protein [Candidatus Bathyarchaeota archaeon]